MKKPDDKQEYVNDTQFAQMAKMTRTNLVNTHRGRDGFPVKGPNGYLKSEAEAWCTQRVAKGKSVGQLGLRDQKYIKEIERISGQITLDNQEKDKRTLDLARKRGELMLVSEAAEQGSELADILCTGFDEAVLNHAGISNDAQANEILRKVCDETKAKIRFKLSNQTRTAPPRCGRRRLGVSKQ